VQRKQKLNPLKTISLGWPDDLFQGFEFLQDIQIRAPVLLLPAVTRRRADRQACRMRFIGYQCF
jgi:hypothetical protein